MARAPEAARIVKAALAYAGIVFAVGFVFGTLRTLVLAPWLGALGAVLAEVPLMLLVAWAVCRRLVAGFAIGTVGGRLAMGVLALALLLAAEALLAVVAFGTALSEFLSALATPAGAVGFAAQVVFGAMPLLVRRPPGG